MARTTCAVSFSSNHEATRFVTPRSRSINGCSESWYCSCQSCKRRMMGLSCANLLHRDPWADSGAKTRSPPASVFSLTRFRRTAYPPNCFCGCALADDEEGDGDGDGEDEDEEIPSLSTPASSAVSRPAASPAAAAAATMGSTGSASTSCTGGRRPILRKRVSRFKRRASAALVPCAIRISIAELPSSNASLIVSANALYTSVLRTGAVESSICWRSRLDMADSERISSLSSI